jgi:DNA-binding NtrC family response regulator
MRVIWLDETNVLENLAESWETAASLGDAFAALRSAPADVLVASLPLHACSPVKVLEWARLYSPATKVLFFREPGNTEEALELVKQGATHYFDHVPTLDEVLEKASSNGVSSAVAVKETTDWRKRIVGQTDAIRRVVETIELIAERRSTVLILGETGTGKEVVARAIHHASNRSEMPLITVNCSAIPENLIEAELFGHVKGAFTGATAARTGRFEQAHRGTIFLDEIGDLPLDLQSKLLRALQEREFQRVGSSDTMRVDVRVLAATNVNLMERVRSGRFREDLYYRLNVVPLRVPSLRERAEDIPLLARHFIDYVCEQERIPVKQVSADAMLELARRPWPGNVRQLENTIEMAVVLSGKRSLLTQQDFTVSADAATQPQVCMTDSMVELPEDGLDFEAVIGRIELNLLQQALERANGNKKAAADMLHLKRTTLAAKLKSLGELGNQAVTA